MKVEDLQIPIREDLDIDQQKELATTVQRRGTRKATSFDSDLSYGPKRVADNHFVDFLPDIEVLTDEEVYGRQIRKSNSPAQLNFQTKVPLVFLLKTGIGHFIVSTEGYNYARYIAKMVGPSPGDFGESLDQITPRNLNEAKAEPRRSTRPLKKHSEMADQFLQTRQAIDGLNQQIAAVRAIIASKEEVAGNLARDLMSYAEEYQDRMFQTKKVLVALEDIPPHKAKVPQWTKVIKHLLQQLESVSSDMRKEAEEFIEAAKNEIPGSTELLYKELENVNKTMMGESWIVFKKILNKVKQLAQISRQTLDSIVTDAQDLLSSLADDSKTSREYGRQ